MNPIIKLIAQPPVLPLAVGQQVLCTTAHRDLPDPATQVLRGFVQQSDAQRCVVQFPGRFNPDRITQIIGFTATSDVTVHPARGGRLARIEVHP